MKDKICCEKPMIYLGDSDYLDMNILSCKLWVCGTCGGLTDEREYSLDEEEFINLADTYEELKDTEYYKSINICSQCNNTFENCDCENGRL